MFADPPGWDGRPRGEPGIHGVARARRWDAVVAVRDAAFPGDAATFVVLADGTVVGDAEPAFVDALTDVVPAPYRAEAVRQRGGTWAVGASAISVVELPGARGSSIELVVTRAGRSLQVDGLPSFAPLPALEAAGAAAGPEHVVRATRLAGDTWEVETTVL